MIRPFRAADLTGIAGLLAHALQMPITPDLLARDFLIAPGFHPDHILVTDGGVVLAPRHDEAGPADTGWIAAIVAPPGHGSALLAAALDGMRRDGIRQVDVADVPVRYLVPGIDRAAHPQAHALFTRAGFADMDEVASMGIATAPHPPDPAIRLCLPGSLPDLQAFLDPFGPGWWAFFRRSILARLHGDPTPSSVIAWWEDGRLCGAVQYRGARFGPLAVGAGHRGRGIGAALTRAALDAMQADGIPHAHFMIATPAVQPFYTGLGFTTLRRFTRMRLMLRGS